MATKKYRIYTVFGVSQTPNFTKYEKVENEECEQIHAECCAWINRFNNCESLLELQEVVEKYRKSNLNGIVKEKFFFFNYIFKDLNDKKRFDVMMQYISSGVYPSIEIEYVMCLIFNPEEVLNSYNYSGGSKSTIAKYKKRFSTFVEKIKQNKIKIYHRSYFDEQTQFFCEETNGYLEGGQYPITTFQRYFETFEEFSSYKKGDLRFSDLSAAYELNIDKSKYVMDETTKLPVGLEDE